jgi:hypothetical protein
MLRNAVTALIAAVLGIAVLGCQDRPPDRKPASASSLKPSPQPADDDTPSGQERIVPLGPVPKPKVEEIEPVPQPKREAKRRTDLPDDKTALD